MIYPWVEAINKYNKFNKYPQMEAINNLNRFKNKILMSYYNNWKCRKKIRKFWNKRFYKFNKKCIIIPQNFRHS